MDQLFDWGNRNLEQTLIQRRLEEQAIVEQAARVARARQAAVAGGGKPNLDPVIESNLLAEDGEFLITENDNNLIQE